jgi:pSer/pThr/pTyr-binding forkhead associated (FHA) protein
VQIGKVKLGDQEFTVAGTLSIGRTADNAISFPNDSNVSRNHAQIQQMPDGFYVSDLGSSNGTAVNGVALTGPQKLQNGDFIILGNSSTVIFQIEGEDEPEDDDEAGESVAAASAVSAEAGNGSGNKVMLAGAAGALCLAMAIGATAFYFAGGSACNATAKIVSPEAGDTIIKPTEIEVEAENAGCVAKAVFTVDGTEFATTQGEPFEATIDPKDHPDLADGFDHVIGLELYDKNGERIFATGGVLLAFETREVKPPANTQVAQNTNQTTQTGPKGKEVSLIDVQQMSKNLVKQFSGNFAYNVSNKEFLKEVQKRTAEYAQEGYFDRAAQYRDQINVAFVREQNLDAPLGYFLAMSRSKFAPAKQGSEEGLFRMSNEFVTANAYNGLCGTETIGDASQNCAAKAAALYMKSMVFGVFEGDVIYAAAAFGKSPQDAGAWKATLPANRMDLWASIRTPAEREALVRFFAAGIVAENPQKFGLKRDRPLSELYRLAM